MFHFHIVHYQLIYIYVCISVITVITCNVGKTIIPFRLPFPKKVVYDIVFPRKGYVVNGRHLLNFSLGSARPSVAWPILFSTIYRTELSQYQEQIVNMIDICHR